MKRSPDMKGPQYSLCWVGKVLTKNLPNKEIVWKTKQKKEKYNTVLGVIATMQLKLKPRDNNFLIGNKIWKLKKTEGMLSILSSEIHLGLYFPFQSFPIGKKKFKVSIFLVMLFYCY